MFSNDMGSKDKKKEIVRMTAKLLSSADGAEEVTTRRIAENAGINPAMVNYYFGSKDGLLKEAISSMDGDRHAALTHEQGGSRKSMFDYLVGLCESSVRYAGFGLIKDSASFSKDVIHASSRLIEMKTLHDGKAPEEGDAALCFKTVCFLMTASANPDGFAEYSGIDIRIKGQLRPLVSRELDILLGDTL